AMGQTPQAERDGVKRADFASQQRTGSLTHVQRPAGRFEMARQGEPEVEPPEQPEPNQGAEQAEGYAASERCAPVDRRLRTAGARRKGCGGILNHRVPDPMLTRLGFPDPTPQPPPPRGEGAHTWGKEG